MLWGNLIDVALVIVFSKFIQPHPDYMQRTSDRRQSFVEEIAMDSVMPHMRHQKSTAQGFQQHVTETASWYGLKFSEQTIKKAALSGNSKSNRKKLCSTVADRKATICCDKCEKYAQNTQ